MNIPLRMTKKSDLPGGNPLQMIVAESKQKAGT